MADENPAEDHAGALAAISRATSQVSRYTGQEAVELVRQIAAYEGVPAEQVVLGEVLEPLGLHLGLNGGPGGELVYSVPGYNALVDAARPVGGVSVGVELDITERKLYEEALFREKESAQITLQSIGDGVVTTDANSTVDYINPVAEQLTGWRLEDAMGRPFEVMRHLHREHAIRGQQSDQASGTNQLGLPGA